MKDKDFIGRYQVTGRTNHLQPIPEAKVITSWNQIDDHGGAIGCPGLTLCAQCQKDRQKYILDRKRDDFLRYQKIIGGSSRFKTRYGERDAYDLSMFKVGGGLSYLPTPVERWLKLHGIDVDTSKESPRIIVYILREDLEDTITSIPDCEVYISVVRDKDDQATLDNRYWDYVSSDLRQPMVKAFAYDKERLTRAKVSAALLQDAMLLEKNPYWEPQTEEERTREEERLEEEGVLF